MKRTQLIFFSGTAMILFFIFGSGLFNLSAGENAGLSADLAPVFVDYGKPLFTNRNSSDPTIRVFKWNNPSGELYLYTSCDLSGPGIYPMSNTYCYESTDEVNWIDHGEY